MAPRMTQDRASAITPGEKLAAAFVMAASGAAWLDLLMQPRWSVSALGPICGHGALFALHCPSCYAAAALIAAGAGLAVSAMARAQAAAPARAAARPRKD
jgi:hypothetical protein